MLKDHSTDISNVLVIGCGGAGLRSAIEAKLSGLTVKVLGKRSKFDSHTVLAAGGVNAAFGNVRYRAQAFPYIYEGESGSNPTGNFIEGGGDHLLGMTQKDSTHTSVAMTRLGGYRSWDGNNINGTDYSRTKSGTSITPGGRILVCNINV